MIFAAKVEAESRLVGVSPAIRDVNAIIAKIATSDCCVLIEGESGTGKELVARRIHMLSSRAGRPFLPVNCAGVSEGLFESQFFGHVRGAFTGAEQTMRGLVRTADGGTLFLDEIGDMPLSLQPKFLRVLQEGEVLPVGQSLPVAVNTRFVAATNRSLRQMVREEAFREDLFYRLNVVWIHVPPLRERPDDIPPLVEHFNAWFATKYCKEPVQLSHAVCQRLSAYSWPGNVRELSSWFERLYALDARPESMVELLMDEPDEPRLGREDLVTLDDAQRWIIRRALDQTGSSRQAANLLQIHRNTLARKIKQYDLDGAMQPELGRVY